MTPLIDIAAREYPRVPRDVLAHAIETLSGHLNIADERYLRVIVILSLRALILDKPESLAAAAVLLDIYEKETRHVH